MPTQRTNPHQDPVEGARDIIDHELARGDRHPDTGSRRHGRVRRPKKAAARRSETEDT